MKDPMYSSEMVESVDRIIQLMRATQAEYGERCPDHDPECPTCIAWDVFDRMAREETQRVLKR